MDGDRLEFIPLSQIQKPKITIRPIRRSSPEYIEMVESMKEDGVLQPILVRPVEDEFDPVEGNHRAEAARDAGLFEVPCLIRDMTDRQVLIYQLKCNAIRPKTHTFEYARRLKLLWEDGLTLNQLSREIDKHPQWIRNQIQLNRLCEEAREPVENGDITMKSALALANLPEELQPKFIDDAIAMRPSDFVARANAARRDFESYLLKTKALDREIGAATPKLRAINVLKREAIDPKNSHKVLEAVDAKTPEDGWLACLAWVFKLDPISVEQRRSKYREKKSGEKLARNSEYHRMNREMIKQFMKSNTGDNRNVQT